MFTYAPSRAKESTGINPRSFTVSIIGRPNVGKSTLFNRLAGKRKAITSEIAGTTRDRVIEKIDWDGKAFVLVDTAGVIIDGLEKNANSEIEVSAQQQIEFALSESDLILFVVDGKSGLIAEDKQIASKLRKSGKEIILVINKIDDFTKFNHLDFSVLGFNKQVRISSISGKGSGDLLDAISERMSEMSREAESIKSIVIIGRPNVGKSSLFNKLLGEERSIVSDIPGTTRDVIDSRLELNYQGRTENFLFVDTAGFRRRGKIKKGVEKFSLYRAIEAVERADIVILVVDAVEGLTRAEAHLAQFARDEGKNIIVAVNKIDCNPGKLQFLRFPFLAKMKMVYINALTGENINELKKVLLRI